MRSPLFGRFNSRNSGSGGSPQGAKIPKSSGLTNSLRSKISSNVMKQLGGLGELVEALLKPFGKSLAPSIEKEIEAQQLLTNEFHGFEQVDEGTAKPSWMRARPEYRIGTNPPPEDDDWRYFDKQQIPAIEGPILVSSSNVYSIAFEWTNETSKGNLLVRFLAGEGKNRAGPGLLYRYFDVDHSMFKSFKEAASAGTWVWDHLRLRGSVVGHQVNYELAGLGESYRTQTIQLGGFATEQRRVAYIPRAVGNKRGETGQFYTERTFGGRKSTLPERKIGKSRRSNIPGWDRRHNLKLRAGGRP